MDPITLGLLMAAGGAGIGALSNKKNRGKGALIGAGIGAATGLGLGAMGAGGAGAASAAGHSLGGAATGAATGAGASTGAAAGLGGFAGLKSMLGNPNTMKMASGLMGQQEQQQSEYQPTYGQMAQPIPVTGLGSNLQRRQMFAQYYPDPGARYQQYGY